MRKKQRPILALAATLCMVCAASSFASVYTLSDENSTADFDPSGPGQTSWVVDGTQQLFQQWFWYRIGTSGPESQLSALAAPVVNSTASTLNAVYTGPTLKVTTTYSLLGGSTGSGTSDLSEQIRLQNLTGAPLTVTFFEYVDLDLGGDADDDYVEFTNLNTATQWEGPAIMSETVDTLLGAATTHREVNFFANTANSLNDGGTTILNDNMGPIGPGDVTWAFQWDFVIPANGSKFISKDKALHVPEPMSMGFLALGSLLCFRRRRVG